MRKLFLIMILSFAGPLFSQVSVQYTGSGSVGVVSCQPDKVFVDMTCIVRFFVEVQTAHGGLLIQNAPLNINGSIYYTNSSGYVDIPGFVSGQDYPYSITMTGYDPVSAVYHCSSCRGIVINLTPIRCDVTFHIYASNGISPPVSIAGATVTINSVVYGPSGSDGLVTVPNLSLGSYSYTETSPYPYGGATGTFFIPDPNTGGCPAQINIHVAQS